MEIEHKTERGWVRGAIIGAGASGTVSLAMNISNGQLFAVKSAAGFGLALDNEYHILQRLDSPYIVRCLGCDYSVENGAEVHNLFMEYMPGGCIADLLAKFGGRLDESVIRAYTCGILRGIHYLHRQGIVHCDIKGKNVLVGANGVKLADFGSARMIGDEEKSPEALQLRGTPQWMAPEVVNQVEQGPASDIWSFACTVLEMATGRPPWSHVSSALAAMYRIGCTEELPELPASLSLQLRDFLEKCFRRDPKKRWTSEELLNHPFLNEQCSVIEAEEALKCPKSPISHLDFRNQVWDSYSSETISIPSLNTSSPTGECNGELNRAVEKCPRPSPRDRMMALAAACKLEDVVVNSPNWITSPHGQWIVVKSSTGAFLTSGKPVYSASSESVNWEELQTRCELDDCLESAISAAQPEHQSSSSISVETLHLDMFSGKTASNLIKEAWDTHGNPCKTIASGDPEIQNMSTIGGTFCSFHDKLASRNPAGAVCCPCCRMWSIQCSHKSMIKWQLYISCRANTCIFNSKLISTKFNWLHVCMNDSR